MIMIFDSDTTFELFLKWVFQSPCFSYNIFEINNEHPLRVVTLKFNCMCLEQEMKNCSLSLD